MLRKPDGENRLETRSGGMAPESKGRRAKGPQALLRRWARSGIFRARRWLNEPAPALGPPSSTDVRSMFAWLQSQHSRETSWRPQYVWSVVSAARSAALLGLERVVAIELGVAGGNGLLALEAAADMAERLLLGVHVDVYGFDTSAGLPRHRDRRDASWALHPGDFAMDEAKLRQRIRRAQLVLGLIGDTVPQFLEEDHAPIGFIAFDLDYYSSTIEAFALLEASAERLLPRIFCYFDDIFWPPWTDFNGERAAIADFNAAHDQRRISALRGLKYSLPRSEFMQPWPEMVYLAEILDHPSYDKPDSIPIIDLSLRDEPA